MITLAGCVIARPAEAQRAEKIWRIGFLRNGPPPKTFIDGLRQGLRDLGYVEGQNIALEYGIAETADQLRGAAAELVHRKVDVLLASGTPPAMAAKGATSKIPSYSWPRSTPLQRRWLPASPGRAECHGLRVRTRISWEAVELLRRRCRESLA